MSVFKRVNTWYFRFSIKGTEFYRSVPEAANKTQALKAEARFKGELLAGRFELVRDRGEVRFSVVAGKFLEWSKENKRSWRSDVSRITPLLDFFGSRRLREISPIMVEKYKSERRKSITRRKKQRSPATVNRELALLRRILNFGIENQWLRKNPVSTVKFLREERGRERYLTAEEEWRLLDACSGPHAYLRPIVMAAVNTGLRKGELLGLTWDRVDFSRGTIRVTHTKSGRDREVPMNSLLRDELLELREGAMSEHVFANPLTGRPFHDLKRSFTSVCRKAGVENFVFHSLRHTAATRMVASGIDLVTVKEILGHRDVSTTMRYSHTMPDRKILAVEQLAEQTRNSLSKSPNIGQSEKKVGQIAGKVAMVGKWGGAK